MFTTVDSGDALVLAASSPTLDAWSRENEPLPARADYQGVDAS